MSVVSETTWAPGVPGVVPKVPGVESAVSLESLGSMDPQGSLGSLGFLRSLGRSLGSLISLESLGRGPYVVSFVPLEFLGVPGLGRSLEPLGTLESLEPEEEVGGKGQRTINIIGKWVVCTGAEHRHGSVQLILPGTFEFMW